MKTVVLTFESESYAVEFMERYGKTRDSTSNYQAELLGLCAKDATSAELIDGHVQTADVLALTKELLTIRNMCDAPHWTSDRRWRIRDLASYTVKKVVDKYEFLKTLVKL